MQTPEHPHPSRSALLCVDCKHMRRSGNAGFGFGMASCDHPANAVNLVEGLSTNDCHTERRSGLCGPSAKRFAAPPPAFAPDAQPARLGAQFNAQHDAQPRAFTLVTDDGAQHTYSLSAPDAARLAQGFATDAGGNRLIHTPNSLAMLFEAAGDDQGALDAAARAASACGSVWLANT